ncbi:MAG: flagellar basal body rod protein FlgF [Lysobacteraceae bacterium]|jgi:flagellar basal-body rod protein FlgF|nr:flagellar basal body rod protein FlgF [Xanthomonadaceae bacterium]MCZ8319496.1 flagellar basal body rod protein FlgF [Silanimonas sp.]
MDKALYVAMTGAQAALRAQAAVSHNLANASTTGFKALLHATEPFVAKGEGLATRTYAMGDIGGFDSSGGSLQSTGNPLDFALNGADLWMSVADRGGQPAYTRATDLKLDATGRLTNGRGQPVLDDAGSPIAIPPFQSLSIGADGTVAIVPQGEAGGQAQNVARIGVVQADPRQLTRGEDGLFRLPPDAAPTPAAGNVLMSGVLENSNVNATEQLVAMISLSRQFEMNLKVIRSGDENARASATLLRAR